MLDFENTHVRQKKGYILKHVNETRILSGIT